MSFNGLLVHKADVQEPSGTTDRMGQPSGQYIGKLSDVPCRMTAASGSERVTLASRDVLEVTHVVFFDGAVGIEQDDRLTVKDPDGNTLEEGLDVLLVRKVSARLGTKHHLECLCSAVRS